MENSSSRTRLVSNHQQSISWRNNPQRLLTVEIVIFLYVSGVILEIPVIQQCLYDKAKEELQVTGTDNDTVCNPGYKNSSEYKYVFKEYCRPYHTFGGLLMDSRGLLMDNKPPFR